MNYWNEGGCGYRCRSMERGLAGVGFSVQMERVGRAAQLKTSNRQLHRAKSTEMCRRFYFANYIAVPLISVDKRWVYKSILEGKRGSLANSNDLIFTED